MKIIKTKIPGVLVIDKKRFYDDRGFFCESWSKREFKEHGIDNEFVQDNHSFSAKAGTLRGLHFQYPPAAQAKLVRCGRGEFLDVVVDIRSGSPTFGRWISEVLSFENGKQLFVPEGFLHGFITRVDQTEIIYKCSSFYAPELEGLIKFNDPDLNIPWPIDDPNLSDKDANAKKLVDLKR